MEKSRQHDEQDEMMNMTVAQQLNTAITRRNITRRAGIRAYVARNDQEFRTFALHCHYWESKARFYAKQMGTQLVEMPGRPGAIFAEAFLSYLPHTGK